MNKMKWIELSATVFEDDKLLLLEQMENGPMLQLLWIKLLCLAGQQCRSGVLLLTEGRPYTPTMLAKVLRMDKALVKSGMDLMRSFGMLTYRDGTYTITNWERHQSMTAYQRKLAYDREFRARERAKPPVQKSSSFLELAQEA